MNEKSARLTTEPGSRKSKEEAKREEEENPYVFVEKASSLSLHTKQEEPGFEI